ncbi:MAG: hypothetical protein COS85_21120 [Armatimonadetes bacterium CG07_land_8_20_14_0_80_59_28]|nr:MAG: hypothetical protein COS85_21120 [Armatimonadetes bacterium CG07_land_8_20_14_0_80_59_28]PJB75802.1 MAG: hypothetical protein CO095_03375 [Armatimonadetes bacterium CG_4_9_14_3_um_filter_58_7]
MKSSELFWLMRFVARSLLMQVLQWKKDLAAWRRFIGAYLDYKEIAPTDRQPSVEHIYPCFGDDVQTTPIEPTYFYQDTWAFERIVRRQPALHVDVGSHHRFVSFLSQVVPVTMVDLRPWSLQLSSIQFEQGSILALPFKDASVPSVSSLCVIEHVGLGRYGDPLDPWGSEKAVEELKRIIQPEGDLYVSVPLDETNRVYFNAHRAFEEEYVLSLFSPLQIEDRRYICGPDFFPSRRPGDAVGCFHFRRPR